MAEVVSQGSVTVLDLHFQTAGTVGAFLIRTSEGPVLVETGPLLEKAPARSLVHLTYQDHPKPDRRNP
jgi:hypothetical protein